MRDRRPFWEKVAKGGPDECWPWTGYVGPSGHGKTSHHGTNILASRLAWILTHGQPHSGLCVNHRCDNPLCCNPAHMYLGSRADNMKDMWLGTPAEQRGIRDKTGSILSLDQLERLYQMRRNGASLKDCAKEFNMAVATVCRLVNSYRRKKLEAMRQRVRTASTDVQN